MFNRKHLNKVLLLALVTIMVVGVNVQAAFAGIHVGDYDRSWPSYDNSAKYSTTFYINSGTCAVSGEQYATDSGAIASVGYAIDKKVTIGWAQYTSYVTKTGNITVDDLYFNSLPQSSLFRLKMVTLNDNATRAYGDIYDEN